MQDSLERLPDEHPQVTLAIEAARIIAGLQNITSRQLHKMIVEYVSILGDVLVMLRASIIEEPDGLMFVVERRDDGELDGTISMSNEAFANLLAMKKLDEG